MERYKDTNLFRDENMIERSADTQYLSPILSDVSEEQGRGVQTVAAFRDGQWVIEGQVRQENSWWVSNRTVLDSPPHGEKEWIPHRQQYVEQTYGLFSGLGFIARLLLLPVYLLWFVKFILSGKDIRVQYLKDEESNSEEENRQMRPPIRG